MVTLFFTALAADPAITVSARQRYPWNGLVEAGDEDYADGYEWYALVTDLDMDARGVRPHEEMA